MKEHKRLSRNKIKITVMRLGLSRIHGHKFLSGFTNSVSPFRSCNVKLNLQHFSFCISLSVMWIHSYEWPNRYTKDSSSPLIEHNMIGWVLGQLLLDNCLLDDYPGDSCPPKKVSPWKMTPEDICPQLRLPPGKLPQHHKICPKNNYPFKQISQVNWGKLCIVYESYNWRIILPKVI